MTEPVNPLFSITNKQYNFFLKQRLSGVFSNSNGIYSNSEANVIRIFNMQETDLAKLQFIITGPPEFSTDYSLILEDVTVTIADVTPTATFTINGLKHLMNEFIQYNQVNGIIKLPDSFPAYVFTPFYNNVAPDGKYFLIPEGTDTLSQLDDRVIRTLGHVKYYNLVFRLTDNMYMPELR